MEQLIPIASKLQDVLGALGQTTSLDLPQIVVVGGQSSGKSSVLESLVGRSFLPRGTGIVTRRPLILQLYNTAHLQDGMHAMMMAPVLSNNSKDGGGDSKKDDESDRTDSHSSAYQRQYSSSAAAGYTGDEWGEFLHLPDQKFYDFGAIRLEIVAETARLTGNNKGIDPTPIHLKIFSPRVLALTLVDLPGIAKVPVGDQPADIEKQIQDMCVQFTSNPNAIILAVTSANTDLANSDALKLAQAIDPAGNRTVGVLTKLDLMDPGTDCADILQNQVIPLRRGYVAVVNRGQKDVVSDISIRDGLKKEEHFFKRHPVYARDRTLLAKCGTARLAKTLNSMLMHHIRDCLPDLKTRISHMMADMQKELDALGSSTHNASRSQRGAALLSLLSKFATNFGLILEGKGGNDNDLRNNRTGNRSRGADQRSELMGGARISFVFNDVFAASLISVGAFDGLTDEEIRTTICNANGTRPALFVPEISFDILARRQIARLEQPGIQCVDLVYDELQRIATQAEPNELTRFPILRDRMIEVVSNLLRRCVGPTQLMVSNLVKIELAYINTSHPDFIGGSRAVAQLMEKIGKENDKERSQAVAASNNSNANGGVPDIGATPLSSSSLNNYYDGAGDMGLSTPRPYEKQFVNGTSAAAAASGGLMNFMFRGKPSTNPRGGGTVMDHPSHHLNGGGPPAVVHLPQVPESMKQTDFPPTDRERVEMEVIKSLVESYFIIVRKNFIDMVPKTIMYFLVNHVKDSLQNELVSELYREAEMGQLMQEAEDIASRRATCMEMTEMLGKALEIVNEVRDFNSFS